MPLLTIINGNARRCRATAKSTHVRCRNLAAYGLAVCRVHGAHRPESVKRGPEHPAYKHGGRTKASEREASQTAARLRELESIARSAGLITGPRTRGRRPRDQE